MALLAGSCGGETALRPACPAGQLCLEYGNVAEPGTLDPHKAFGTWEVNIIGEMLVSLTEQAADGATIPGLATHWETSADGLTWTFHLRDANWSDGVPVTADDFVYSARRLFDPATASPQASQFYPIKNSEAVNSGKMPLTALGFTAPDFKTVVITLEHPWPILPDYVLSTAMAALPRHAIQKYGEKWVQPGNYVSDGPYSLASWAIGDKVVLQRNPRYYDAGKVCIDRIDYYPVSDLVSAERRVKRGELDLNGGFQSNRITFLKQPGQMPDYVRTHPFVGVNFVFFNMKDVPALKDRRVRQAISMAIDRTFITEKLLRADQQPAYSYVSPGMIDYDNAASVPWKSWSLARRQDEARRLLEAAGYTPDKPLKLETTLRAGPDPILIQTAIQADLKAVGVQVSLLAAETQVAYSAFRIGDFQIGEGGWVGANDAMGYLSAFRADGGVQNYPGYNNPAYDALLDQADVERDLKVRAGLMARAETMLLNDAPVAPLYFPSSRNLVNPNITGWIDNVFDTHKARFLCWRDAEQRRSKG